MADISSIEHSTFKVPYEVLNKRFRAAQKTIDREVSQINQLAADFETFSKFQQIIKAHEVSDRIEALLSQLESLQGKCQAAVDAESESARLLKGRIDHVLEGTMDDDPTGIAAELWKKQRFDRLLIDYLLRAGHTNTAKCLAKQENLADLCNVDIYDKTRDVTRSLREHDSQMCLEYCHDNKSKLRRLRSELETKVRQQEFIELIRGNQKLQAVQYAKKYFSTLEHHEWTKNEDLLKMIGLLAFQEDTSIPQYRKLFSKERWDDLADGFAVENDQVYSMSEPSAFATAVQCGLSALKTPHCYSKSKLGIMEKNASSNVYHDSNSDDMESDENSSVASSSPIQRQALPPPPIRLGILSGLGDVLAARSGSLDMLDHVHNAEDALNLARGGGGSAAGRLASQVIAEHHRNDFGLFTSAVRHFMQSGLQPAGRLEATLRGNSSSNNGSTIHMDDEENFGADMAACSSPKPRPADAPHAGNPDCPICIPEVGELARTLPYSHASISKLICGISGDMLDENNPPLMLPNGNVYGHKSLAQMAETQNGKVTCPRTSQVFEFSQAYKLYVM